MQTIRSQSQRTALLLLALMLVQVLLGAVEASLQSAPPLDMATHHETAAAAPSSAAADNLPAPAVDDENCDHCCQCHGHGSHFAAAVRYSETPVNQQVEPPGSGRSQHTSTFLPVLLRPPIA